MSRIPFRKNAFHSIPNFTNGKYVISKSALGKIYTCDAVELVKSLPDDSVDLVITDPAYESLEKWRSTGTTTRLKKSKGSSNKWFKTFPNSRYPELFKEFYRVMKKGTFLYCFCDEETRDVICCGCAPQSQVISQECAAIYSSGLKYWKSIIWDKVVPGMGYHYRAQHEFIIMAEKVLRKGKHRRLNFPAYGDVLSYKRLKGKKFYPTEKPSDLISLLIAQSTDPDGEKPTVLDPFCGSGVVGQMCNFRGIKYILGDIDSEEAKRRLC